MNLTAWTPKSLLALRNYNGRKLSADVVAGVTVGLVALPLSMAFAIASGAPPEAGLYTAVVAGFAVSALGGSRTQVAGPTGAFVVIVAGILARYGFDGLLVCTIMAGCLLIALGATGLGAAVKFIPRPVIVGFTNGIAILIASTQIKDFFGLQTGPVPGDFIGRMRVVLAHARTASLTTTILSCSALLLILLIRRFLPRIPGYIIALVGATLMVYFAHLPVETIGTRFGGIPSGFPRFHVPVFDYSTMRTLISPAITVALLGAIESLMSAVVADRMSGDEHNPNVELVAQGFANILSPLFGGLPATGAIARTATSIRCGAVSPVAGMVHALTVLAVLLFAAPLARFIPLAVLAAILAALVFIRKVTLTTTVTRVTEDDVEDGRVHVLQGKDIPSYLAIFRIHGPFLFGASEKVDEIRRELGSLPPIVVLRLRNMTALDSTGLQALERLALEVRASGRTLLLCGAREQPARLMRQASFARHVGAENICPHVTAALERAHEIHDGAPALS